jgi:hypothetical protein
MQSFREYWTFSAIRGALTLLVAAVVYFLPQATAGMFHAPVSIYVALSCFAVYFIFDAAVMVLLTLLLPGRVSGSRVLYAQAGWGLVTAGLIYAISYGAMAMHWLMIVVAVQTAVGAIAEESVASGTHPVYGCLSCYTSAIVLGVAALGLPFAGGLDATATSLILASVVGLYGASELSVGGRMLFLEYRSEHPAPVLVEAWRAEMEPPAAALHRRAA